MSVKNWNIAAGLFSSACNWSPNAAPVAGDNLYIKTGAAILFNQTFGSEAAPSSIGLIGNTADNRPQLVMWNATLKNVVINDASQPYSGPESQRPADYYTPQYGRLLIAGVVTNDGGEITASGNASLLGGNGLDIMVMPSSTLINHGSIGVTPGSTMVITGYDGSTLENDKIIDDASGRITISAHLTGTGDVYVGGGAGGGRYSGSMELNTAVDAGQTFHLSRSVLQVDQPAGFLGQIEADPTHGGGKINLEGLAATSWDARGSALEFFDKTGSLIDTLRFTTPQDAGKLEVYATPDATYGSVVSVGSGAGFGAPTPDSLLPWHNATAA